MSSLADLPKLIRLCVFGAATIVCLTVPRAPALAASSPAQAAPLSPAQEKALKPKDTFKECANCPEMVVVPPGNFTMASPPSEPGHNADEGPQHMVTIAQPFAVGRVEGTFDEWDACIADGGCNGYKPVDEGWGRGRRPVINVSWDDATAYANWLSKKTGKPYRCSQAPNTSMRRAPEHRRPIPGAMLSAPTTPIVILVAANGTPGKPLRSARLLPTGSVSTTW